MSTERIGLKIKHARERLRWSVPDLAREADIKQRTLEDIESGVTKDPGFNNILPVLEALSKASGEPMASFFDLEDGGRTSAEALSAKGFLPSYKQLAESKRRKAAAKIPNVGKKIAPIQPQPQPGWPELARLVQYYVDCDELDTRLLGLYILSENPDYIDQYASIDRQHAADAVALKRILSTS